MNLYCFILVRCGIYRNVVVGVYDHVLLAERAAVWLLACEFDSYHKYEVHQRIFNMADSKFIETVPDMKKGIWCGAEETRPKSTISAVDHGTGGPITKLVLESADGTKQILPWHIQRVRPTSTRKPARKRAAKKTTTPAARKGKVRVH